LRKICLEREESPEAPTTDFYEGADKGEELREEAREKFEELKG